MYETKVSASLRTAGTDNTGNASGENDLEDVKQRRLN